MEYPCLLNQEQINFLIQHKVPSEKVFDAKNMSKQDYRSKMKRLGKIVAFNVTPCKKSGHQLRSRSGHCIMCNTSSLGFQKRNDFSGFVYFAFSEKSKQLKVGFTESPNKRINSLNAQSYGNTTDWIIKHLVFTPFGMHLENQIHQKLYQFATKELYPKTKEFTETRELYRCDVEYAMKILNNLKTPFEEIPFKGT